MGRVLGVPGELTLTIHENVPNNVQYAHDKIKAGAERATGTRHPSNANL